LGKIGKEKEYISLINNDIIIFEGELGNAKKFNIKG
jgi:hypothetical protein